LRAHKPPRLCHNPVDARLHWRNFASKRDAAQAETLVILIFYAFAREVGAFKRRLADRAALGIDGLRGFRGRLGSAEIVGIATGLGIRRAADTARRALQTFAAADLVIATGLAGALSEELQPGDLVLGDCLLLDDECPGLAPATIAIPPGDLARFKAALEAHPLKFATGTILTAAQILKDGAAKRTARATTGALAVDMESAAIATEADRCGMRFACVRAVLDTVDEEIVGAELAGPDGEVRPLAAAGFVLRNPGAVIGLARMMRSLNRATAALANALEALSLPGA
jgi:adenosylhomocysteine nucleosidase